MSNRVVAKEAPRVNRPPVVGSLGLVYVPEERRLDNNLTIAVDKVLTTAIQENMKPPDPKIDHMARRLGKLYKTGTDSINVASSIVNILDATEFKNTAANKKKSRRRKELVSAIQDDGMYLIPEMHGHISPAKAPMRSSDAVRLMETRPGGKYFVPAHRKKEATYTPRIFSAPNHDSIVNKHSPRMWSTDTMYTPSMNRAGSQSVLPTVLSTVPSTKRSLIPVGDEQFPLTQSMKKPVNTGVSSQSLRLKNFTPQPSPSVYGCSSTSANQQKQQLLQQEQEQQQDSDISLLSSVLIDDCCGSLDSSVGGRPTGSVHTDSVASLYSKHNSKAKKPTKVDRNSVTEFNKSSESGKPARKAANPYVPPGQRDSPGKSKGGHPRGQGHGNYDNSDWFPSMATNVTTGSTQHGFGMAGGSNDVSLNSKSMSTLQQVLLRDGYHHSDVSIDPHHPEAGSVGSRTRMEAGGYAGGCGDSLSNVSYSSRGYSTSQQSESQEQGKGQGQNQPNSSYPHRSYGQHYGDGYGNDDIDAFELIPLPELYENCRIKEANRQHKKAVAKHAEWLVKSNPKSKNRTKHGSRYSHGGSGRTSDDGFSSSDSSPALSPRSPIMGGVNGDDDMSHGGRGATRRGTSPLNVISNGGDGGGVDIDLEFNNSNNVIPKRVAADANGPSELEKWRLKIKEEEEKKIYAEDVANQNTVGHLLGPKVIGKQARKLKQQQGSSYTEQLSNYLQLTTAHSGVKTWNQEQMELNSSSYTANNGIPQCPSVNSFSGTVATHTSSTTQGSSGSRYGGSESVTTAIGSSGVGSNFGSGIFGGASSIGGRSEKLKKVTVTNPYRTGILGQNRGIPTAINMRQSVGANDNISYSKNVYVDNHFTSNYTLVSSELLDRLPLQGMDKRRVQRSATVLIDPLEHTRAPTKASVTSALNTVARKGILAYDTRIVEIGATIRACVDIRHPVPGIAAVMALHRAFIDMASTNPNPATVTRAQVFQVVHNALDWQPVDSIDRLISAYDPQHTGVIRYVRITTALVACCRPNMAALNGKRPADVHSSVPADCISELLLLRLMHQMYDESEGGGARKEEHERVSASAAGSESSSSLSSVAVTGMKIDDIVELLSCCAASIQDEIDIEKASEDMLTLLYIDIQNDKNNGTTPLIKRELTDETRRIARVSIKHSMLKELKGITKVSKEQFIKCLSNTPKLLKLFSTQAKHFRALVYPYMHGGSVPFADTNGKKAENYGTQRTMVD